MATAGRAVIQVWGLLRSAPATLIYLFTLLITQLTLSTVDDRLGERLLISESTNLVNMARVPLQVLIGSAFWIDAGPLWTAAALVAVALVLGPAERWLGTARWLAVTLVGHVGATLLTVAVAMALLRAHRLGPTVSHASDVGVSYAVMAGIGVLLHRIPRRGHRAAAVLAVLALLALPLVLDRQVADLGHPLALLLGVALYPLIPAMRRAPRPALSAALAALPRPTPPGDDAPGNDGPGNDAPGNDASRDDAPGDEGGQGATVEGGRILLAEREKS